MVGGSMGFWQGDVKKLATDMQALKPSVFAAVPRILNKLAYSTCFDIVRIVRVSIVRVKGSFVILSIIWVLNWQD